MSAAAPATLEREKDKLYLTDAELIRRLGVPEKGFREKLKTLDADPKSKFPAKDPLFGNRRYWPAVRQWLERQDRPSAEPAREVVGKVYFLASETHVKIGFSAAGVRKRVRNIKTGHYDDLRLIGVISPATLKTERALHQKFAAVHVRGEWFKRCPEIEECIRLARMGHLRLEEAE